MTAVSETRRVTHAATGGGPSVPARFAVGALWSVFGAGVSRGLTLGAFVLAGRLLGPTRFGEVGMVQSTQGLLGVLAGGSLGLAATRYVAEHGARDRARAEQYFALIMRIALVSAGVGALALVVFAEAIAANVLDAPHLVNELRLATGLLLFGAVGGVQSGAIAGLGRFRALALLAVLRGACFVAALMGGIWLAGVPGAVAGLVLTEAVAVAANSLVLRRLMPRARSGDAALPPTGRELGDVCRFTGLAVVGSIATTVALWAGNVILVRQPDGFAALGVFNAAERWRLLLLFVPTSVSPIVLSMLSRLHGHADRAGYRQLLGVNLWVGAATVLIPAAGVVALAPLAMSAFGEEYRQGAMTLAVLAASAVAVVLNNLLGQVLVSKGAVWCRAALDVLLAAVFVVAAWALIPSRRDEGMALAHLMAYGVTAVVLIVPVTYYLRQPAAEPAAERD
jgi:O-antigen/teichoic acid export membrane protein